MGEQREFMVRQIVWAKVQEYPWWPAKIVKTLEQPNRNVYKVHFFGDPTYSFLEPSQLLDFEDGLLRLQPEFINDFKLRRSIQLARAAQKRNAELQQGKSRPASAPEARPHSPEIIEETKVESKPSIENAEPIQKEETPPKQTQTSVLAVLEILEEISEENVTCILDGSAFKQLKLLKGYANKKEVQAIKSKLKSSLLSKYRLHDIPKIHLSSEKEDRLSAINAYRMGKRQLIKKMRKARSSDVNCEFQIKKRSVRKIYKILTQREASGSPSFNCREKAISIVEKMEQKHAISSKEYRRQYRSLLQWLRETESSGATAASCADNLFHLNEDSFFEQMSSKSACHHTNVTDSTSVRKDTRKGTRIKIEKKPRILNYKNQGSNDLESYVQESHFQQNSAIALDQENDLRSPIAAQQLPKATEQGTPNETEKESEFSLFALNRIETQTVFVGSAGEGHSAIVTQDVML